MSMSGRAIARNAGWLLVAARWRDRAGGWGMAAAFMFIPATIDEGSVILL